MSDRAALEARWLELTRELLPRMAIARRWPIRADHCFQRVLLDNACGGRWYDHVEGRPAYRRADATILARAVTLDEAAETGSIDLEAMNRRSLAWRGHSRASAA